MCFYNSRTEEIESSEATGQDTTAGTKVRGLRSLLKEVERRRRRMLQELEDSVPVRGPTDVLTDADTDDVGSPGDMASSIHLADTVPAHLHPGHPPTRGPPVGSAPVHPSPLSSLPSRESTTELPDSSSTVLPLSEESLPSSLDFQPFTTPSLSHRSSTPAQPGDTHAKQPQPARPHTITSDTSSPGSDEIKINVDVDVGTSSLIGSDSTLAEDQHHEQQTEAPISSTDYFSPPSELPRRQLSLQEIEDNLKRIQEYRRHHWDLLNHLSWKKGSPGSHTPITTYLEKLKEEGSGKRPITKKGKFELQKRELIQYYIQRLLQRGDHEGDLSASTVEGSGLSLSSLGSLLSYLEGDRQKDQHTDSPTISSASPTSSPLEGDRKKDKPTDSPTISSASPTSSSLASKTLSAYEDIDEFPVRMRSKECVRLPSPITTASSALDSARPDPIFTATSVSTPTATSSSTSSSLSSLPSSTLNPHPQHYLSSSSSTHPSQHTLRPHIHPLDLISSLRQKHELSSYDFVSTTSGSSTSGYVFLSSSFINIWDNSS